VKESEMTKRNLLALLFVLFGFQTAFAAEPSVAKLGINFHLVPHFHKPEWTWTPSIRFRIYGPLASSDTVSVEYTFPDGKQFVKVQCENVSAIKDDENLVVNDCGFRQEDSQATNLTGLFGFQIKLTNELSGTNKSPLAANSMSAKSCTTLTIFPTAPGSFTTTSITIGGLPWRMSGPFTEIYPMIFSAKYGLKTGSSISQRFWRICFIAESRWRGICLIYPAGNAAGNPGTLVSTSAVSF
jgi:hypothetical protein